MPKVPLREEGTALQIGLGRRELDPLPRVQARTDFRPNDFGAEAGRELQVVGHTLQDISGAVNREILNIQEERNVNNAMRAYNRYSEEMNVVMTGLLQTQGDAALDTRPTYDKEERRRREAIFREFGLNDNVKRRVNLMADRDSVQRVNRLFSHATEEHQKERVLQPRATLNTARASVAIDPSPGNVSNQAKTVESVGEVTSASGDEVQSDLLGIYEMAAQALASQSVSDPDQIDPLFASLDRLVSDAEGEGKLEDMSELKSVIDDLKGVVRRNFYIPLIEDRPEAALQLIKAGIGMDGASAGEIRKLKKDARESFKSFPARKITEQKMAWSLIYPEVIRAALRGDPAVNTLTINRARQLPMEQGGIPEVFADHIQEIVDLTQPAAISDRLKGAAEGELGELQESISLLDEAETLTFEQAETHFERLLKLKTKGISEASFLATSRMISRTQIRAIMRDPDGDVTNRSWEKVRRFAGDLLRVSFMGTPANFIRAPFDFDRIQVDEVDREVARLREAYFKENGLVDADRPRFYRLISEVQGQMELRDEDLTRANFEQIADLVINRAGTLLWEGVDPRLRSIPEDEQPDSIFVRGKGGMRRPGATPVVVEPLPVSGIDLSRIPQGAKDKLLSNPDKAADFDERFKMSGAAEAVLSGG